MTNSLPAGRLENSCSRSSTTPHHDFRMENVADQRHQQHQEGKERQNGVGGDGKSEGMHLGAEQIARGGADNAFARRGAKFGCAFFVGRLDGSDGRHWVLKYYQILTAFRRAELENHPVETRERNFAISLLPTGIFLLLFPARHSGKPASDGRNNSRQPGERSFLLERRVR